MRETFKTFLFVYKDILSYKISKKIVGKFLTIPKTTHKHYVCKFVCIKKTFLKKKTNWKWNIYPKLKLENQCFLFFPLNSQVEKIFTIFFLSFFFFCLFYYLITEKYQVAMPTFSFNINLQNSSTLSSHYWRVPKKKKKNLNTSRFPLFSVHSYVPP